MTSKIIIPAFTFILFTMASCYQKPIEMEQYKNEVYIINAYSRVYDIDYKYKPEGEMATNFITVSSSGSLPIPQKAMVSLAFADTLVEQYNLKYIGDLEAEKHKWYTLLDHTTRVEAPGLESIEINPADSIRTNINIAIKTYGLDPDIHWALPITVTKAEPYPVSSNGRNIMLHLNLINDYSGYYKLAGRDSIDGEVRASALSKTKMLTAINESDVRLFYAASTEGRTFKDANAIVISVDKEHPNTDGQYPVSIRGWKDFAMTEASGTYDPEKKVFNITYKFVKDSQTHIVNEVLTFDRVK